MISKNTIYPSNGYKWMVKKSPRNRNITYISYRKTLFQALLTQLNIK